MEAVFTVVSQLSIVVENESKLHNGANLELHLSPNLDRNAYFSEDGHFTKEGTIVATNTLVQGLIGNIHQAHQKGTYDSAIHLRHIISELERGFIAQIRIELAEKK